MLSTIKLFTLSFLGMISVYLLFLGEDKTVEIIKEEYLFILALVPIVSTFLFFKIKLKDYEIINFNKNNNFSLKTTISIFLIFQIVDYIYEDGFIGMISQWFMYWIMGLLALVLLETINYYKNYKLLKS